jgi:ribosome-associated toxin RatA of RatAB toxin-antitoxin module
MPTYPCRDVDLSFFAGAPERFVLEVELPCTPRRLFDILEDPASWPQWAPGIRRVEWTTPKPHGVGATRTVDLVGGMSITEHFILWEQDRTLAFYVSEATQPVWWSFAERYQIEPVGHGRCRLTWTVAYEPRAGTFARLHPWIRPAMHGTLKLFTWLLRSYVKRNSSRAAAASPQREHQAAERQQPGVGHDRAERERERERQAAEHAEPR